MGADMIIEYIIVEQGTTIGDIQSDLLSRVKELTVFDDYDFIHNFYKEYLCLDDEDYLDSNNEIVMSKVREQLNRIIDGAVEIITEGYRDIVCVSHKGDEIYLTGGMSCGDDPTDSYSSFCVFNMLREQLPKSKIIRKW